MPPLQRKALSLETKLAILKMLDTSTKTYEEVGATFKCPKSTIAGIVRSRKKIEERKIISTTRKKLRGSQYPQLEDALMIWIKTMRAKSVNISGTLFREKAIQLSVKMGISNFKATQGWFDRFKKRNEIIFRAITGESQSVSVEVTTEWGRMQLPKLIEGYNKRDIYNLDETALFFKLMPNKTMMIRNESCSGGKLSKDRITVLVGANADGSEKLPLLVIGKAMKPRCFKNIQTLPVLYKSNKKAWMTFHLWEEYIRKMDLRFAKENRKVLFFVDNAPSHLPISDLRAIKMLNFPANTTSILQPMDQGVIKNLKGFYRELVVKKIISFVEQNDKSVASEVKISLLDALHLIKRSWDRVKSDTILNCFKKAYFICNESQSVAEEPVEPLMSIWNNVTVKEITNGIDVNMYISVDDHVETSEDLSDEALIELTNNIEIDLDEGNSSDPEDNEILEFNKCPSLADIERSFDCIRKILSMGKNCEGFLNKLHQIENFVDDINTAKLTQSTISDFFKSS